MRADLILIPLLAVGLILTGCSRSDASKLKADTQAVGHDLGADVRKVGDDPDLKAAGDQIKTAAHDTGEDLRKAGHDIGDHTKAAVNETKDAADK
jgi:hypothetical protein